MIAQQHTRLVAGVMSGTSLDGIDVALATVQGHGREIRFEIVGLHTRAFPNDLQDRIMQVATQRLVEVDLICTLNVVLAKAYATAVKEAMAKASLPLDQLHLVGCHGQTIRHLPDGVPTPGGRVRSTWQLGDCATLAQELGVPVIGGFRAADMAAGGQGAPLVPYFDYVALSSDIETRICLNLGGIANVTVLPAGGKPHQTFGFDTGPGNMVLDALANELFGVECDRNGHLSARGTVDPQLLAGLLDDEFYRQTWPKSTGREHYGPPYVSRLQQQAASTDPHDIMRTAVELTAVTVAEAYEHLIRPRHRAQRFIASGGGVHNPTLWQALTDRLRPIPLECSSEYGIDTDGKEALCFAVLAHETANGYPTGMPGVTGAWRAATLGSLSVP